MRKEVLDVWDLNCQALTKISCLIIQCLPLSAGLDWGKGHVDFTCNVFICFQLQFALKWLRPWGGMIFLNCLPVTYRVCCWQHCQSLYGGGRTWLREEKKTLVHKTAVKQISTHRDQENVKKYVLLRTLLATWNLLWRINIATLQVFSNLVTEKYIELLRPSNLDWKNLDWPTNKQFWFLL